MCAMASNSYDWDLRNKGDITPKIKKQPFFDFFRFSRKLSIRFERDFLQSLYALLGSYVCTGFKFVCLRFEKLRQNQPKNDQKRRPFLDFSNFRRKYPYDSNEIFYLLWSYVSQSIKIVKLGCELVRRNKT